MKAIIDGIDYTEDIVEDDGYEIEYVERTSGESFTSINGVDFSNVDGYKARVTLTFNPMIESKFSGLLRSLITKKYVPFIYDDPGLGNDREIETIISGFPSKIVLSKKDGTNYWGSISVTFSER